MAKSEALIILDVLFEALRLALSGPPRCPPSLTDD
tara:strand:- start:157 stop:261 length:105 start_codon:yes stop_codon:yes gene_type:complete